MLDLDEIRAGALAWDGLADVPGLGLALTRLPAEAIAVGVAASTKADGLGLETSLDGVAMLDFTLHDAARWGAFRRIVSTADESRRELAVAVVRGILAGAIARVEAEVRQGRFATLDEAVFRFGHHLPVAAAEWLQARGWRCPDPEAFGLNEFEVVSVRCIRDAQRALLGVAS